MSKLQFNLLMTVLWVIAMHTAESDISKTVCVLLMGWFIGCVISNLFLGMRRNERP